MESKTSKKQSLFEKYIHTGPIDVPFLVLTLILTVIGLIMVLSASYPSAYYGSASGHDPQFYFKSQLKFAIFGVLGLLGISFFNYKAYKKVAYPALFGSIILLAMVLIPGLGAASKGATRWLAIPGLPKFQPSELVKYGVILSFAARMSERKPVKLGRFSEKKRLGRLGNKLNKSGFFELVPYGLVLLAIVVIMAVQKHMSGTILILVAGAAILFAGGVHWGWFVAAIFVVGGGLGTMMMNTDYTRARLDVWLDPWLDPLGKGYQAIQSLIAIGSGGLLGLGLGNSRQKFLYLPEEHNDFIFAVVCEELGYIGAGLILILYAMLILRGYWLAMHTEDRFGALLIVGIVTLLAFQVVFNVAVVSKLMPVTGISLPFFSYGGTALLTQLVSMGVVLAVSRQIPLQKEEE